VRLVKSPRKNLNTGLVHVQYDRSGGAQLTRLFEKQYRKNESDKDYVYHRIGSVFEQCLWLGKAIFKKNTQSAGANSP